MRTPAAALTTGVGAFGARPAKEFERIPMKSFSVTLEREVPTCFFAFALPGHSTRERRARGARAALFNVGARAYAQGEFIEAIEAFEEAYRASGLALFSTFQSRRPTANSFLRRARAPANFKHYHAYLVALSTGKYRVIAAETLAELDAAREKAGVDPTPTQKNRAEKPRTRVMVSRPRSRGLAWCSTTRR